MAISRTPHPVGVQRRSRTGLGRLSAQPRAGVIFDPGALVVARVGSTLAEIPSASAPRSDLILLGTFVGTSAFTASSTADANGGSLDSNGKPEAITIEPLSAEGTGDFSTGSSSNQITVADRDRPAFMYDNDTYYRTDAGGTLSFGGWVADVLENGKVVIKHSAALRALYDLYTAGAERPSATEDGYARVVATNIPAGTFSGGVFTVTATGAFPTQDGLAGPYDVGDVIIFPLGTITTQLVSAANSGPYQCTTIGATGVQAVFTRPSWWKHGDTITPGTKVTVGGEGTNYKNTVWVAKPATAAKVVGADDPLMFPEQMIIPLTCASGTASTALCPLRAPGLFAVLVDFTGGSPAATTTSIQASTQTPGGIGTASIVIQEQDTLGSLVATGTATATVTVRQ